MAAFLRISILLFGVFVFKALNGQQVSFEYITAKNGLPQSTIRGIVKDKYGFMWFGTWNGLCRYDGYSFKIYRTIPGDTSSLASNRIHYLYKDQKGDIWISVFNETVCRYNYNTDNFTRFKLTDLPAPFRDSVSRMRDLVVFENSKDFLRKLIGPFHLSFTKEHIVFETPVGVYGGLNDNNVNCIYRDDADILWVGTGSGGINKADLNASRFQSTKVNAPGQPDLIRAVRSMWVDSKGIWLGTEDDGLVFLDFKSKTTHYVLTQLKGENIKALLKDKNGNIWIGKRSGLDKYDPVTKILTTYFDAGKETEYSRFYAIAEDPLTGELWFSYYNGVLKYDPHVKTFEKQPFGFYTRSGAGCLFFDSKNNLWIGTEYAGLVQLKRKSQSSAWSDTIMYTSVASDTRSPDERVYSVTEDSDGSIWLEQQTGLAGLIRKPEASKVILLKLG
ncbi:ligand-binding sensor domain-containing protein [Niabella ginsengisoli]|uniref:Histidine kinase n=1 Tax=Niabella ginsengisoli TaxID=522298 RepID=A0ABS9SRN1_9BACT|nr:two-component regulator propeller domain-containing protein [Niabella ginsengisoli]MCH5600784.1 hypothetical protein [Niabella ginsengisoli]